MDVTINDIIKFANEIKAYCKLKNTCYGCPFWNEEVVYEESCGINDRPLFWKEGKLNENQKFIKTSKNNRNSQNEGSDS